MKKLVLSLLISVVGFSAQAQYKVGDPYEKDGVKAVVIHVNEDGSHGLIWKLDKVLTKAERKNAKKARQNLREQIKKMRPQREAVMLAVCDRLTGSGKHNFEVIKNYFLENNLNMAEIFPEFEVVTDLGEDWFVPGDEELLYFSELAANGEGKKQYRRFGVNQGRKKMEKVNTVIQHTFPDCKLSFVFPFSSFKSSTCGKSDKGKLLPHRLCCVKAGLPKLPTLVLLKNGTISATNAWHYATCAAVSEF